MKKKKVLGETEGMYRRKGNGMYLRNEDVEGEVKNLRGWNGKNMKIRIKN